MKLEIQKDVESDIYISYLQKLFTDAVKIPIGREYCNCFHTRTYVMDKSLDNSEFLGRMEEEILEDILNAQWPMCVSVCHFITDYNNLPILMTLEVNYHWWEKQEV